MYKLLTTVAIVAISASSASAWTGAKDLINNLNTVYTGVDGAGENGSGHFERLSNGGGELNTFLVDVDKGVTHISLEVQTDNTIVPTLNEGKTLAELNDSAGNLVNRINYDLFHDATPEDSTDDGTVAGGYTSTTDYTITNNALTTASYIDHTTDIANAGLVGNKINDIVTGVDTINSALVNAPGTTPEEIAAAAAANTAFIAAYNGSLDEEHYGVNIKGFNEDITEINSSITAAGGANFFSDTANFGVDSTTLNNFATGGTIEGNGVNDGTTTYPTLLDWANGTNGVDN